MANFSKVDESSQVEYYYVEKHIINETTMDQNYDNFLENLNNFVYYFRFDLDFNQLNVFLEHSHFKPTVNSLEYTNEKGCIIYFQHLVDDDTEQDYYTLRKVSFIKNDIYKQSYYIYFDGFGLPNRASFIQYKKIIKDVGLQSINYTIDKETFKIESITYSINDKRKYQKCINGYIAMIVEHPLKKISTPNSSFDDLNIYDVYYTMHQNNDIKIVKLTDILRDCELCYTKMYGRHYTHFLNMNKMFNKRELLNIGMMYI
jgi:hypothetical protein